MNKLGNAIMRNLPFVVIILLNVLANGARYYPDSLKPYLAAGSVILLLNLLWAARRKLVTYFMTGITAIVVLGTLTVLFNTPAGGLFLRNVIPSLYVALFCVAFFPPLLGLRPFTHDFSKKDYPPVVWRTRQFSVINLILNYIWAGIFVVTFGLSMVHYSESILYQQLLQNLLPIAVLLLIGYPLTKNLPAFLQQRMKPERMRFRSAAEMFEAMPFGLNRKKAEGIDTVVQFHLTGDEAVSGYLTIRDQTCTYTEGDHADPTMTINSPSKVWLDITNGDLAGDKALINGMYTAEGDVSLLLKFDDLFSSEDTPEPEAAPVQQMETARDFAYGTFKPGYLKNILVVDGGGRSTKFSKSSLMARKFCDGAESAGAEVEYVNLRHKNIRNCRGCYTCWTKTPGVCRFKDDMPELLEKLRTADLIVYVSPLFVFSVTALLKTFLDRSIPNIQPYMMQKNGYTLHPYRYKEDGEYGLVIFSAGGFPEVKGNFDGISNIFRNLSDHAEIGSLIGEFYLPGAELIAQPVYGDRRKMVEDTCYEAGRQAVEQGRIDIELMERIQDPGITQDQFKDQANMFWESLDGKAAFYKVSPQL